jgi:hypothetical protein
MLHPGGARPAPQEVGVVFLFDEVESEWERECTSVVARRAMREWRADAGLASFSCPSQLVSFLQERGHPRRMTTSCGRSSLEPGRTTSPCVPCSRADARLAIARPAVLLGRHP